MIGSQLYRQQPEVIHFSMGLTLYVSDCSYFHICI